MGMFDDLNLSGEQSGLGAVLKEYFNTNNMSVKSDLSMKQIKTLYQDKLLSMLKSNKDKSLTEIKEEVNNYLLQLMCSYNRGTRKEVIDGIKKIEEKLSEMTTLTKGEK